MIRPLDRGKIETFADVLDRIGNVPARRVLLDPRPGTATEKDLIEVSTATGRLFELVHGTLVEKTMGWHEGRLGFWIGHLIQLYLDRHNLGVVAGPEGMIRFKLGLVRMPDVSFVSWDKVDDPAELENPAGAYLEVAPDLTVEVLSENNTQAEMTLKLAEYARAGVKTVWYVNPDRKEVDVFPRGRASGKRTVGLAGTLKGGTILPGFRLPVRDIFASRAPERKRKKKGGK